MLAINSLLYWDLLSLVIDEIHERLTSVLGLCPYAMLFCFITENDFCSVVFLFPEAIFKKILFNSDLMGI